MTKFENHATFRWLGKPNSYPKGNPAWHRTELARKMSGKTVGAFTQAAKSSAGFGSRDPQLTLNTLWRKRLIEIEGHKPTRANKDEMEERRDEIYRIVEEMQPMTVRQVFYQATVRGIVDKNEKSYDKVQQVLAKMRRDKTMRFDWIVDNTRDRNHPFTFDSVEDALEYTARNYRKSLWQDADAYVEIWLEKDALAGVIEPITHKYDVSLMVARGYSSLSFLYEAAQEIDDKSCPVYIYHLGDYDPSGVNAGEKIEEDLQEFAPNADINFERIAVTPERIRGMGPANSPYQAKRQPCQEL